jgi:putative sugar O-methyltransferase
MVLNSSDIFTFLSEEIKKNDPGSSSHWNKFHSDFEFTGEGFKGLKGFGGTSKPYTGLQYLMSQVLQEKFRRIGKLNKSFLPIEKTFKGILEQQGRAFDLDVLRQIITVSYLKDQIPNKLSPSSTTVIIGDGFSTMATLLLANNFAKTVILVNLNKTLLVDLWYLKIFFGDEMFKKSVKLITDMSDLQSLENTGDSERTRVIAIQASNHEILKYCPIDLAINIASMQEMDPQYIRNYFDDLYAVAAKRDLDFYCCNREEKTLPDGTVTRFKDYPWNSLDGIHLNELCPWHNEYYCWIPPFYRPYDGPHRHQLRKLNGEGYEQHI